MGIMGIIEEQKDEIIKTNNNNLTGIILTKKICSNYVIKIIFSYLDKKKELEIIKHNKNIQQKLYIKIDDYKRLTEGRYKIGGINGNGKEYNIYGDLIFEGEYLNGKRNGYGKEYEKIKIFEEEYINGELMFEGGCINGKEKEKLFLIYEGEYINGKRNGKGKEYNLEGKIIFEGEYLNGKKNGIGKEYDDDSNLIFEGEYLKGLRHKGTEYNYKDNLSYKIKNKFFRKIIEEHNNNKIKYEVVRLKRKKNGKGKEYYCYGIIKFEGEYLEGLRWNGKGYNKKGELEYELINGNGKVKEYYNNGNLEFEGEYLNGKRNGKGKEYYENGMLKFEGEFLNNIKWKGKIKKYNKYDNLILDVDYIYEKMNGKGKEYYSNGKIKYEGEYLNGLRWNGKGYNNKGEFQYELINGNGKVKEYNDYGDLEFEGEYINGKKNEGWVIL